MEPAVTFETLRRDPGAAALRLSTPAGAPVTFRPLTAADAPLLGAYFLGLSEMTRSLYGPHPFDQATADNLCAAIDYTQNLRMVAVHGEGAAQAIIAYFILSFSIPQSEIERYAGCGIALDPARDLLIAPSLADDWQNRGLGSPMMQHALSVARALGRRYAVLMGGVFVHNQRAVHFYQKNGFGQVGTFIAEWAKGRPSYDMYQSL